MTHEEINWQSPPESKGNKARGVSRIRFTNALRERPGEWAVLTEDGSLSMVTIVKTGASPAYAPAGAFEATSRSSGDSRRGTIYIRFVGEPA